MARAPKESKQKKIAREKYEEEIATLDVFDNIKDFQKITAMANVDGSTRKALWAKINAAKRKQVQTAAIAKHVWELTG